MKKRNLLKNLLPIIIVIVLLGVYVLAVPTSLYIVRDFAKAYVFDKEGSKYMISTISEYKVDKNAVIIDGVKFEYKEISFMVPKAEVKEHKENDLAVITEYSNGKRVMVISDRDGNPFYLVDLFSTQEKATMKKYGIATDNEYEFLKSLYGLTIADYTLFDNKKNAVVERFLYIKGLDPTALYEIKYVTNSTNRFFLVYTPYSTAIYLFDAEYPTSIILDKEYTQTEIDVVLNSITITK